MRYLRSEQSSLKSESDQRNLPVFPQGFQDAAYPTPPFKDDMLGVLSERDYSETLGHSRGRSVGYCYLCQPRGLSASCARAHSIASRMCELLPFSQLGE